MEEFTQQQIGEHLCYVKADAEADFLLIQPVDSHDVEELSTELEYINKHARYSFSMIAVKINHWHDELSPWPAPPVFGNTPFGGGAVRTLHYIVYTLLPGLQHNAAIANADTKVCIGGYSLAGLFALWAGYQQQWAGVVAASPSVWFSGWIDYAASHPCLADKVYLSLGDREHRSRTPMLQQVDVNIRRQNELLTQADVKNVLQWNAGNHFQDNGVRTAKGFCWVMNQ